MDRDRADGPTRLLSATGWLGVALGAIGALLLFLGWFGASGESVIALQVPYLASGSIPGAALLIAGATLLSGESARRSAADSNEMIATLFELLTTASDGSPVASAAADEHALVMVPGGNRYHRSQCSLVEGKPGVVAVDSPAIRQLGLQPCPVCNPVLMDR